jgi:hypothetical protein
VITRTVSVAVALLTTLAACATATTGAPQARADLPSGRLLTSSAAILTAGEGKYDPCDVANRLANLIIHRVRDQ